MGKFGGMKPLATEQAVEGTNKLSIDSEISDVLTKKESKSLTADQVSILTDVVDNDYQYMDNKNKLEKILSLSGINGDITQMVYDEGEGKLVIGHNDEDKTDNMYIINTKDNTIKNIQVNLSFSGILHWELDFIIKGTGFVTSAYAQSDHAFDYTIYDFEGNVLKRGNRWVERGNESTEKSIIRMKAELNSN